MEKEFLNRFAADLAALFFKEPRLGEALHGSMEFRGAHANFLSDNPKRAILCLQDQLGQRVNIQGFCNHGSYAIRE